MAWLAGAAPAWQKDLSSPTPGPVPVPAPSVVDMQVTWNGMIDSGKIRMEFAPPDARKPGSYIVRFSSASSGAAAVLFPYQSHFWSEIDPRTLRPKLFNAVEVDSRERITLNVRHFEDRVESVELTQPIKKQEAATEARRTFEFQPVFDMFSAMLFIRSQKLDPGDEITLALHPLDSPYLLRVKVIGREIHNGRNAIRLTVGMRKIRPDTLELRPYRKLKRDTTLWITDDAHRVPIEFRAYALIGDIRATLTDHREL